MDEKTQPRLREPLGIGMPGMLVAFLNFHDTDSGVLTIDLLIICPGSGNHQSHAADKGNKTGGIFHDSI